MKSKSMLAKHLALILIPLLLLGIGCSAIRVKYEGTYQDPSGKTGSFEFEKSYNVSGGIPAWCGLSAIFWGGACWYYTVMPTVAQKDECRADAEEALKAKLQVASIKVTEKTIARKSWANQPQELEVVPLNP